MNDNTLPEQVVTTNQINDEEIAAMHDFYQYGIKEKKLKITIPRTQFIDLMLRLNYFRYNIQDSANAFIHIENGRVSVTNDTLMVYAVEDYIRALPERPIEIKDIDNEDLETIKKYTITPDMIRTALINNVQNLIGKNLDFLRARNEFVFLRDTDKCKYLFFNNHIVEITADGINTIDYSSNDKLVWESSIIDFDFQYTEKKGEFEQFFEDITGEDAERKTSLMSALGYLMHDYYDYDLRAIFLTDVNLDFDTRAGGTGKGILGKALMQMLNRRKVEDTTYVAIPGNDYDGTKENRYSRAEINTQLLHIEDAKKTFKAEHLVNDITDGVFVRKMYRDPFIKYMKVLVSTNFAIDFNNPTTRRRAFVFELTNFFSDKFRPSDKYKKWFFGKDWDADDWNQFYSFMLRCCRVFMTKGLVQSQEQNYSNRVLLESTDSDFVDWFTSQITPYKKDEEEKEFVKDNLFLSFIEKYPDSLRAYTKQRKKFTEWCQTYCRHKSVRYCEIRSTDDLFIIYPSAPTLEKSKQQKNKFSE